MVKIDLEHSSFSEVPTVENLKDYPTMLDILDSVLYQIALDSNNLLDSCFATTFADDGYLACTIGKGPNVMGLIPKGLTSNMRFRGQSHYYSPCFASYDRITDDKEKIMTDLHAAEFEILLMSHPVIQFISRNFVLDNHLGALYFNIDYVGLAQHYGIPTRVFDFTNDLMVSAFFAVTEYDKKTDSYSPYIPKADAETSSLYGVLYYMDATQMDINDTSCRPLGMHYFNRPGVQSGFAFDSNGERDLNKNSQVKKIFFRHDAGSSNLIYKSLVKGNMLFPKDSLCGKVKQICERKDVCSKAACELWMIRNGKFKLLDDCLDYLKTFKINIVDEPWVHFEKNEIDKDWNEWITEGKDKYLEKVTFLPMFKMKL